jgi:hypothetical protein
MVSTVISWACSSYILTKYANVILPVQVSDVHPGNNLSIVFGCRKGGRGVERGGGREVGEASSLHRAHTLYKKLIMLRPYSSYYSYREIPFLAFSIRCPLTRIHFLDSELAVLVVGIVSSKRSK